jgi:GT2 family glycosyltransferase
MTMGLSDLNVAFVVLTYNRSSALRPVLQALARQCAEGDEVVVADDGSRPEHVAAVRDVRWGFPCRAVHVWHPDEGFTAASARNMGVLQTSAPYVVFLDGDCVPGPDFVARHREFARPGCFVNGSRVLLSPSLTRRVEAGEVDLSTVSAGQWLRYRAQGHANKWVHLLRWPAAWRRPVAGFSWKGIRSCNLAVWREDFMAIEGFDETFNGWGHEDADFVLRLHQHGLSRLNAPLATEVFHLWHQENPRHNEQINRQRVHDRVRCGQVRAERGVHTPRSAHMWVSHLA